MTAYQLKNSWKGILNENILNEIMQRILFIFKSVKNLGKDFC